jgi:hypothetical protein
MIITGSMKKRKKKPPKPKPKPKSKGYDIIPVDCEDDEPMVWVW